MPLIHCEINLISASVIHDANGGKTFAITYTKLSASEVTLSTQTNSKLQIQIKWRSKQTNNL